MAELVSRIEARSDPAIPQAHKERVKTIARRARHAVVHIATEFGGGTGSFISPDGYIITNSHVVENAATVDIVTYDGQQVQGQVVARVEALDPDLALVKVGGSGWPFLPLADEVTVGATVVYVGHPSGAYWVAGGGSISRIDDTRYRSEPEGPWITGTDVVFSNPTAGGTSGASLVNCAGEVVAINYGGTLHIPDEDEVSQVFQNEVIRDQARYLGFLVDERRAVGMDDLRAFLAESAPGLIDANRAVRDSAVTRVAVFDEPDLAVDLCRICIIENVDHYVDHIRGDTPAKQAAFLQGLLNEVAPKTLPATVASDALAVGRAAQPAVVRIEVDGQHRGTGSLITPDGYILTNAHVAGDASELGVVTFDGREFVAQVVGNTFPENQPDLALLKVEAEDLPWLELADGVAVGDTVVGVGHPHTLEWVIWAGEVNYVEAQSTPVGYVEPIDQFVQDDGVDVGGGSSGSPVLDLEGRIVKIHNSATTSFAAPESTYRMRGHWLRPVVLWDEPTITAAEYSVPSGIHVDLVRRFVENRVPGLLD